MSVHVEKANKKTQQPLYLLCVFAIARHEQSADRQVLETLLGCLGLLAVKRGGR